MLLLRDFAAGYFFLKRNAATEKATLVSSIMAYVSAAIPLFYFGAIGTSKTLVLGADLLSIIGFLMVAFATLELGTSIGIAPANRGLVRSGIYRYIKHPMYTDGLRDFGSGIGTFESIEYNDSDSICIFVWVSCLFRK